MELQFTKMHGCGNDFVIIDNRANQLELNKDEIKLLCDRHHGIGCDQLVVINGNNKNNVSAYALFWNSDGSVSATCGNATRCIASILFKETGTETLNIETQNGIIECRKKNKELVSVNIGKPKIAWNEIPLSKKVSTLKLPIEGGPTGTNFGNPHCTFFVNDLNKVDIQIKGPAVENNALFPERTNVQFVKILDRTYIKLRVWERGSGITLASGSSSCAAVDAGIRRDLLDNKVKVELDGGIVEVEKKPTGVWLTGPTKHVFSGIYNLIRN
ncbi:diaminopimelate epimerase [Paracoccaceae bacterium]|nr:diaminopimelate epimerase [Paracoccaceae bacterium]